MAWSVLPKPGTKLGPCAKACKHRDCAETRDQSEAACALCLAPIGYETRFTDLPSLGPTHWNCALDEQERIMGCRIGQVVPK